MRFLKAPARVLGLTFAMSALAFASRSTRLRSEVDQFNDKLREQFSRKIDISDEFHKEVLVFSGNSNRALAEEICSILKVESGKINVSRFRDGEVNIEVKENVRGKHIFVIQPTSPPVNESLMELLLIVSTLRRSSSGQINVVIPYYGYARQDRKTAPRVPISAADVARLLETVGVDRVIVMDLHSGQAQGFFSPRVPCDNLQAKHVAINYFRYQNAIDLNNVVVVSPDAGGVARAKAFVQLLSSTQHLDPNLAIIVKQRESAGKIASMTLVGTVKGKHAIIIDDIIDTAGTLDHAAKKLKEEGALSVHAFATHGLFSDPALKIIQNGSIDKVIVTNTIPPQPTEHELKDKVIRLSVAPILAEAIYRVYCNRSLSSLFNSK